MQAVALLRLVGRIRPEAWDAIIPHGPRILNRAEAVALNPQPLPPHETLVIGAAEMAHDLVRIAIETEVRGESASGFVREFIDDWCGTPWPHKWPLPWPGPGDPDPHPWQVSQARLAGAIVFASAADRLAKGDLGATFAEGADRLAEAATAR